MFLIKNLTIPSIKSSFVYIIIKKVIVEKLSGLKPQKGRGNTEDI